MLDFFFLFNPTQDRQRSNAFKESPDTSDELRKQLEMEHSHNEVTRLAQQAAENNALLAEITSFKQVSYI